MSMDIADPIRSGHESFVGALKSGGVDEIASLACEDCVWMPPNETSLYGRDEVREWFEEYFQHFRVTAMGETERDVTRMGPWALERWIYSVAILPLGGGERIRDDGRALVLWKEEADGSWKISQFMFNSMRPIGSGTSRFMVRMMERRRQLDQDHEKGD